MCDVFVFVLESEGPSDTSAAVFAAADSVVRFSAARTGPTCSPEERGEEVKLLSRSSGQCPGPPPRARGTAPAVLT